MQWSSSAWDSDLIYRLHSFITMLQMSHLFFSVKLVSVVNIETNTEGKSVTIVLHNALGKKKTQTEKRRKNREKKKIRVRGQGVQALSGQTTCTQAQPVPHCQVTTATQIINNWHLSHTKSAFTLSKHLSYISGTYSVSLGKSVGQNLYSSLRNAVLSLSHFDIPTVVRNMEGCIWTG